MLLQNKIDTDTYIANILFSVPIGWKHISPNLITFLGLLATSVLGFYLFFAKKSKFNIYIIGFTLFFRILADIMDGFVARKFNKTSAIGNQLDTISDFFFSVIVFFYIFVNILGINETLSLFIVIFNLAFIVFYFKLYNNHNELKSKDNKNIFCSIVKFISNNSFLFSIILFFIIAKYYK